MKRLVVVGVMVVLLAAGMAWTASRMRVQPKPAKTAPPCVGRGHSFDCFSRYLAQLTRDQGAGLALGRLAQLKSSRDNLVQAYCHELAHAIGRAAYDHYGSVEAAVGEGNELCASGYSHGVIERYLAGQDQTRLAAEVTSLCGSANDPAYSFKQYSCLHALGHGLDVAARGDVPKALGWCDGLPQRWQRFACYPGVFMQNVVVAGRMGETPMVRPDDPSYPCEVIPGLYRQVCYSMVGLNAIELSGQRLEAGLAQCATVPGDVREVCMLGAGQAIDVYTAQDVGRVAQLCRQAGEWQATCIKGAAIDSTFVTKNQDTAQALCQTLPEPQQADCLTPTITL